MTTQSEMNPEFILYAHYSEEEITEEEQNEMRLDHVAGDQSDDDDQDPGGCWGRYE